MSEQLACTDPDATPAGKTAGPASPGRGRGYFSKPSLRGLPLSLTIFLFLLLPLWWVLSLRYEDALIKQQRAREAIRLTAHGNALTTVINGRFALLEGLYAFALANPSAGSLNTHFETFAAGLYAGATGIRNFALAPGGVQRYVYPLRGNEDVPGHDLINDVRPQVRADVRRAMETRKTALSGPYELRQDGMGIVARKALYLNGVFWGLATMVIDLPPILTEAGLNPPQPDIEMALRDSSGKVIFGNIGVFENDPVRLRIELPEGFWELGGIPPEGWRGAVRGELRVFQSGGLFIAFLIAVIAHLFINRQMHLKEEVRKRTTELSLANEQLNREIEERKGVEEVLRESEERLRSLGNNLPNGMVYQVIQERDGRRRFVHVSAGVERINGVTADAVLRDPFTLYGQILEEDRAGVAEAEEISFRTMDIFNVEARLRTARGEMRWVQLCSAPRRLPDGSVLWDGIQMDITARKKAEEEISKLNAGLEQSVKERTKELEAKIAEIERMNKLFVGRELRMAELKEHIKKLEADR